jgi:hypothetical protein
MLDSPTIEKLKEMKLKVMAEMLADPDSSLRASLSSKESSLSVLYGSVIQIVR